MPDKFLNSFTIKITKTFNYYGQLEIRLFVIT